MLENIEPIIREKQARLVRALLKGEETPEGFDDAAIEAARESLARKRSRAAARTWPGLFTDSKAHERFEAYCRKRGAPVTGALLDGRLFARYLEKEHLLTAEQSEAIARFDSSYMVQGRELRLRNGADRLFRSALRRLTR
ncbi:MAG: hypothetical protein AB7W16_09630 [Candidatus Obscuribacterales bacterium]